MHFHLEKLPQMQFSLSSLFYFHKLSQNIWRKSSWVKTGHGFVLPLQEWGNSPTKHNTAATALLEVLGNSNGGPSKAPRISRQQKLESGLNQNTWKTLCILREEGEKKKRGGQDTWHKVNNLSPGWGRLLLNQSKKPSSILALSLNNKGAIILRHKFLTVTDM